MLKSILIANRGEIAIRVMRTARRMGMRCVAVYSDADRDSLHVALADEAYRLGPAPAAESYLRIDKIIDAAKSSGAEAIHPGYGFLSENAEFAEACENAGLTFIGPPPSAIRAMGLKDAAKRLMERHGVPVVPGHFEDNQDVKVLAKAAASLGYPVLIKARAGGGGKGMRLVEKPAEFESAVAAARSEASSSFGDDKVLVEKFIATARHIEIQVFGDSHGNVVHLFERDCSMQRRHQKVIEEAPAPGMSDALRNAMGEAAVKAAKAVGYVGAGTVEFIVDGSKGLREDAFWFMEMNTRLQVEHRVTEAITGQDLVEWQLRVASGEPLPLRQDQLHITGHAIEARLYAEDPERDFMPATGVLAHLYLPETLAGIDTGVRDGDCVTPYYDPMIAKLIVHGGARDAALGKLTRALAKTRIAGCVTNARFLLALAQQKDFASGNVDTGLIERELSALARIKPPATEIIAVAALQVLRLLERRSGDDPFDRGNGWRHWSLADAYVQLLWRGDAIDVRVIIFAEGRFEVETPDGALAISCVGISGEQIKFDLGGRIVEFTALCRAGKTDVFCDGDHYVFDQPDPLSFSDDSQSHDGRMVAPLPGVIHRVTVDKGAKVTKGDELIVLEAMKMQHVLRAPCDGEVGEVLVASGDQVAEGDPLIVLQVGASNKNGKRARATSAKGRGRRKTLVAGDNGKSNG